MSILRSNIICRRGNRTKPVKESQPSTKNGRRIGSYSCDADPAIGQLLNLLDFRRRSSPLVSRTAKANNGKENSRRQKQTDLEACSFPEVFCYVNAKNDPDDEIDYRKQHQHDPPARPTRDFAREI